jgi:uncharacterized membrane protein
MSKMKSQLAEWRTNFITGLAVLLPAVVSLIVLFWLLSRISDITDLLLFFLPKSWTHERGGEGPMYWYCSLAALLLGIFLVAAMGRLARYYLGRKMIELLDELLCRVPLLNKIYSIVKQVNEAFSSSQKSAFKQVVLVEYPRPGLYSVAFITNDEVQEAQAKTGKRLLGVFVPTTPNPTSGFLLIVPEEQITRLDMSVADGIKYVVSLGMIAPDYQPGQRPPAPPPASPSAPAATAPE